MNNSFLLHTHLLCIASEFIVVVVVLVADVVVIVAVVALFQSLRVLRLLCFLGGFNMPSFFRVA